jgi:hypothetical protein
VFIEARELLVGRRSHLRNPHVELDLRGTGGISGTCDLLRTGQPRSERGMRVTIR